MSLRQPNHKLQPDEITALIREYRAGATLRSLAEQYAVHEQTARRHLRRAGVELRPVRAVDAAQTRRVHLLRSEGWSERRIARELGVSQTAVRTALKEDVG